MESERFEEEDDVGELKQLWTGVFHICIMVSRINHDRRDGAEQKGDAMAYIDNPRVKT